MSQNSQDSEASDPTVASDVAAPEGIERPRRVRPRSASVATSELETFRPASGPGRGAPYGDGAPAMVLPAPQALRPRPRPVAASAALRRRRRRPKQPRPSFRGPRLADFIGWWRRLRSIVFLVVITVILGTDLDPGHRPGGPRRSRGRTHARAAGPGLLPASRPVSRPGRGRLLGAALWAIQRSASRTNPNPTSPREHDIRTAPAFMIVPPCYNEPGAMRWPANETSRRDRRPRKAPFDELTGAAQAVKSRLESRRSTSVPPRTLAKNGCRFIVDDQQCPDESLGYRIHEIRDTPICRDGMRAWIRPDSLLARNARPRSVVNHEAHLIPVQIVGFHPMDRGVYRLDEHQRAFRVVADIGKLSGLSHHHERGSGPTTTT